MKVFGLAQRGNVSLHRFQWYQSHGELSERNYRDRYKIESTWTNKITPNDYQPIRNRTWCKDWKQRLYPGHLLANTSETYQWNHRTGNGWRQFSTNLNLSPWGENMKTGYTTNLKMASVTLTKRRQLEYSDGSTRLQTRKKK